jgi:hypothetical protein
VPHSSVVDAASALADARRKIELHATGRPAVPAPPSCGGLSADELRDIAHGLSLPAPPADPGARARADTAAKRLAVAKWRRLAAVIAGLAIATAAALAAIGGMHVAGVAGLAAVAGVSVVAAAVLHRTARARDAEHREAALAIDAATRAVAGWRDAVETSGRRALDRGLEPNSARLRALAGELDATR